MFYMVVSYHLPNIPCNREYGRRRQRAGIVPEEVYWNFLTRYTACCFTQATYRSIQFCRNFLLPAPMLPFSSNNPSFAWMNASGWASVCTSRYARTLRRCCCAMDVPVLPTETPNTPAGLPAQALSP